MRDRFTLVAALIAVLTASTGCQNELVKLLPTLQQWHRTYLTYHASRTVEACSGNPEYSDGFVPFVARELGIEAPKDLGFLWLDAPDFAGTDCPRGSEGCQIDEFGISARPIHLHELVHVAAERNGMDSWRFFKEGVAVAYDPWTHAQGCS